MEQEQNLAQAARSGAPLLNEYIVDCHMHNGRVANFFSRFECYQDLIAQMDRIGVNCGVVSNLWTTGEHWQAHPELLAMCKAHPGRFWGYLAPDPNRDNYRSEMEQFAQYPYFRGIKLHPVLHKRDFECSEYLYVYAWAGERKMPVLLHTWGQEVQRFYALARRFPQTVFILGHSGGEEDGVRNAIEVAASRENVYLDTACSYVWYGAIEAMVRGAGEKKILYGSDAYWNSMEAAVGRILLAELSEKEKRQILGLNARRLFRLGGGKEKEHDHGSEN